MSHQKDDIIEKIQKLRKTMKPEGRESSYDFCFGYFQTHRHHLSENMELSCLHLWGYLASWGMLRGSSELLNCYNMKVLSGIIEYLDKLEDNDWELDIPDYNNEEACKRVVKIYNEISTRLDDHKISATVTLVTKIMMGTLGCVPAIDSYLAKAYREEFKDNMPQGAFRVLNTQTLECFYEFYKDNHEDIDALQYPVMDFEGKPSNLLYTKAKLTDMYGWKMGEEEIKK